MIVAIIRWSIFNRGLVVLGALLVAVLGLVTLKDLPIDAIPDLSDVQVIVKTAYPGQAPEVVQDQITYPLTTDIPSLATLTFMSCLTKKPICIGQEAEYRSRSVRQPPACQLGRRRSSALTRQALAGSTCMR